MPTTSPKTASFEMRCGQTCFLERFCIVLSIVSFTGRKKRPGLPRWVYWAKSNVVGNFDPETGVGERSSSELEAGKISRIRESVNFPRVQKTDRRRFDSGQVWQSALAGI